MNKHHYLIAAAAVLLVVGGMSLAQQEAVVTPVPGGQKVPNVGGQIPVGSGPSIGTATGPLIGTTIPATFSEPTVAIPSTPQPHPAPKREDMSIDQLLDEVENLRAQKVELEKKEQAMLKLIQKKAEKQKERIDRLAPQNAGGVPVITNANFSVPGNFIPATPLTPVD